MFRESAADASRGPLASQPYRTVRRVSSARRLTAHTGARPVGRPFRAVAAESDADARSDSQRVSNGPLPTPNGTCRNEQGSRGVKVFLAGVGREYRPMTEAHQPAPVAPLALALCTRFSYPDGIASHTSCVWHEGVSTTSVDLVWAHPTWIATVPVRSQHAIGFFGGERVGC